MALVQSINFNRYKNWYLKGSLTDEQLKELKNVGLLTDKEVEDIKKSKS